MKWSFTDPAKYPVEFLLHTPTALPPKKENQFSSENKKIALFYIKFHMAVLFNVYKLGVRNIQKNSNSWSN